MLFITTIVVLIAGLSVAFFPLPPAPLTNSETERIVLQKALISPLITNLIPVIMYEVLDGKTNYGCIGTCYRMTNGGYNMITMAHAFFSRPRDPAFVLRRLTPCEPTPTLCVYRILTNYWQDANLDLVECEVGPITGPLPSIHCDVAQDPSLLTHTKLFTFAQAKEGGLTNVADKVITSLISGERAALCGVVPEANLKSWYFLINYNARKGESGTCFVGEHKRLYFLGGASGIPITQEITREFKLTVQSPATVLGPFNRKN